MIIRGITIQFSSFNKKKDIEKENKLETDIKKLEEQTRSNINNIDEEKLDILVQEKTFIELRNKRIEGAMLHSWSRYKDLGEEPSNYLLNLENRKYINKVTNKLINEKG